MNAPSRKKQHYKINPPLKNYLLQFGRETRLPLQYDDLSRHMISVPLHDASGKNTLWETVYYSELDTLEIHESLTEIYALLKTDGDRSVMEHLTVARIDYCTFGNTKPYRVRIINRLNDNYDHFYVKRADASRVYGLELEHLLSPNRILYLVDGETLIEEHVAGIPGDDFMQRHMDETPFNQIRIAKEFVKFTERCFVRLLGDMRAYNYVVDITPDIEGSQYRLRAIDFDQQSYEGRKNFYLPQYFKENNPIIQMGFRHLSHESVRQYLMEERSLIARRAKASGQQLDTLLRVMIVDPISTQDKVEQLRGELAQHHKTDVFLKCRSMGEIVMKNLELLYQKEFKDDMFSGGG